jgi:hypothetical protein
MEKIANRVISIIYVSRSGNTELMVRAAAEGAQAAGATVNIKEAADATGADVEQCDALIWGSGNYYGYIHGRLKDWFDREHMRLNKKNKAGGMKPRPYFCCLSASANPYRQLPIIERMSAGMNLKKAFEPVTSKGRPSEEVLARCRERGRDLVSVDASGMVDLYVPVPIDIPPKKAEAVPKPVILIVQAGGDDAAKTLEIACDRFREHEVRLVAVGDLDGVFRELAAQGKTNLVVAPLALADDDLCRSILAVPAPGLTVEYVWPLLGSPDSLARVAKAMLTGRETGTVTVVCPSGGGPGSSLLRLDRYLRRQGALAFTGDPDGLTREVGALGSAVCLRPLAMTPVSGECGALMTELAGRLKAAGVECRLERGLDCYAPVLAVWLDGVTRALDGFAAVSGQFLSQ